MQKWNFALQLTTSKVVLFSANLTLYLVALTTRLKASYLSSYNYFTCILKSKILCTILTMLCFIVVVCEVYNYIGVAAGPASPAMAGPLFRLEN